MQTADVLIIGAGAAGLMAAWRVAAHGHRVTVLEKAPKIGVKILMSGGTRCNVTQNTDAAGIMRAFGRNGQFLRQALARFGPEDTRDLLQQRGVATKVEPTGKVFPASDRALDVRDALWKQAVDAGAEFLTSTSVTDLRPAETGWEVQTSTSTWAAPIVIVSVGGKSYPGCGTTGDGYSWLSKLGHQIVAPKPALVPLVGGTAATHALSGLTLEDALVSVVPAEGKRKPLEQRRSSFLFTHLGFSGPAAMDVSRNFTRAPSPRELLMLLDLVPDQAPQELEGWLQKARQQAGRTAVATVLSERVPRRIAECLVEQSGIAIETRMSELPAASARKIHEWLKAWAMPITGSRGFDKAEVTSGGVDLREVDPRTMASRLHKGLFLAGEILDLDGWIGGYNFQSAFCTGFVAGEAAAAALPESSAPCPVG